MATYAIGDIQGCFSELQALLAKVGFNASADRLWLVGDLVNRGPESLAVLRFVRGLGKSAVTVLGNHDLHLIALAAGHARPRADDTLAEVLDAADADELVGWLRTQPLVHAEDRYLMVHAGLLPQWTAAKARELAGEVENALRGPDVAQFLAAMYGGQPNSWDESLEGADRLRVIVNAMTRMRFCTRHGEMEFRAKGETTAAPQGYLPWFDVPDRASRDMTIVCGHWSALGLLVRPDLCSLDSGCVWGGRLTAFRLEDAQVFQVECSSQRR